MNPEPSRDAAVAPGPGTGRVPLSVLAVTGVVILHLSALLVFFVGVSPVAVGVCALLFALRALGVTLGYHRYFAHRSFKTGRAFQFVLGLWGTLAAQGGLLWWVSHHRDHHAHTESERDVHSPVAHGFWRGHIGWLFQRDSLRRGNAQVRDIERYPELVFLEKHYMAIMVAQGVALFGLGAALNHFFPALGTSGFQMLVWGYFVSVVLLLHATFLVNSACHLWGSQPYEAGDNSRNNLWVALLTFGEGWHNNHHKFAYSARHGLEWWQVDISWYLLRLFAALGLVRDLKLPRG